MARISWNAQAITATAQFYTLPLMHQITAEVLRGAKRLAPRGDHLSGSGKARAGRRLEPSINSNMSIRPNRIRSKIGSTVNHAATVHQGSSAHTIRSRSGKMLKFRWDRGDFLIAARAGRRGGNKRTGRFHYFMKVRHPGNKRPVRYLTTPLALFGRINGFRVTTAGVNRSRLP